MNYPIYRKTLEITSSLVNNAKVIFPDPFDDNKQYHEACVAEASLDGLYLEFGVHRGRSIGHIASRTTNMVYGFDSFEGIPEEWHIHRAGASLPKYAFSLQGQIPEGIIKGKDPSAKPCSDSSPTQCTEPWPANVELIKGWFDETLPSFVCRPEISPHKVAFLHIDCDLYSSTKTIFKFLGDQITEDTVIAFDEIYGYNGFHEHEAKAFAEFLIEHEWNYEPLIRVQGAAHTPFRYGMTQGCFRIKKDSAPSTGNPPNLLDYTILSNQR